MFRGNTIVCTIPARGGSKGIPRKNAKKLAGKPLIAYAIGAAKRSRYIDRVIVSTDNAEIANIAKRYGAEVPFLRPAHLAQDATPTIAVVQDVLKEMKGMGFDPQIHVLVQPTSPFVIAKDIDRAIEMMIKTNTDSCVSICEVSERPEWMYTISSGKIKPYLPRSKPTPRQKLPVLYRTNGAVFVTRVSALQKGIIAKKSSAITMPKERSIDIDDEFDFKMAELIMRV